ncbi:unnamed protein product [Musa acuminata subsp. malaccensis]|nr:unnamed protein product [Musa acuminata subsp. malaccensis]
MKGRRASSTRLPSRRRRTPASMRPSRPSHASKQMKLYLVHVAHAVWIPRVRRLVDTVNCAHSLTNHVTLRFTAAAANNLVESRNLLSTWACIQKLDEEAATREEEKLLALSWIDSRNKVCTRSDADHPVRAAMRATLRTGDRTKRADPSAGCSTVIDESTPSVVGDPSMLWLHGAATGREVYRSSKFFDDHSFSFSFSKDLLQRHLIQKFYCRLCRTSSSHKFPSTKAWQQITGRTEMATTEGSWRWRDRSTRRLMIGSTAPTCTYNECKGCRLKCRAEQVPVDAGDPMNSAYRYRCVCHG